MTIVLNFDDGYAAHAAAVMASAIANASAPVKFAILHGGLSEQNQRTLGDWFCQKCAGVSFHRVDAGIVEAVFSKTKYLNIWKVDAFFRLLSAEYVEDDVAVYLDCDTSVVCDVWQMVREADMTKAVNACAEYNRVYKTIERPYGIERNTLMFLESYMYQKETRYGIVRGRYFNSGVMVMNLKMWREMGMTQKLLDFVHIHKCPDQDALNGVLDGDWGLLHPRWNTHVLHFGMAATGYSAEELVEADRSPGIIHFSSPKFWTYSANHKWKWVYRKYRKLTPWPRVRYEDANAVTFVKKYTPVFLKEALKRMLSRAEQSRAEQSRAEQSRGL